MPKNAQATTQLHSFHMLARSCSKPSKLGLNSMWTTKNFQMYKVDLEKAERNQRSNCQHLLDHQKAREFQKNIYFASLTRLKSLTVWITTNYGKFFKRWEYQTTVPASWQTCVQVKKQQLEPDMNNKLVPNWEGVCQGCILSPCLFNLYAEYIMQNAGLDEAWTRIKIAQRHINNLRYADDNTLMAESEED